MPTKTPTWSRWRPFPNPRAGESLTAPFGPGLYELRRISDERLVLIGISRTVALRMTSLLPRDKGGKGTRNNTRKQNYVARHRNDIQYRTLATKTRDEAKNIESERLHKQDYIFPT